MLPDLPSFKAELQSILSEYVQLKARASLGVFSKSPKHVIHEGNRMRVVRADGSVGEDNLKSASSEVSLILGELHAMSLVERTRMLDQMALEMAEQMSRHLFATPGGTLDEGGQVVDAGGKPLDAELIFRAIESVQIDFDDDGNHHNFSIVVGPELYPRLQEELQKIADDPVLKRRHDELMDRKWMEWRDRKAARKLVG